MLKSPVLLEKTQSPVVSVTINSTQYLVQVFSQTAVLCILLGNNSRDLFGKELIASESVK